MTRSSYALFSRRSRREQRKSPPLDNFSGGINLLIEALDKLVTMLVAARARRHGHSDRHDECELGFIAKFLLWPKLCRAIGTHENPLGYATIAET